MCLSLSENPVHRSTALKYLLANTLRRPLALVQNMAINQLPNFTQLIDIGWRLTASLHTEVFMLVLSRFTNESVEIIVPPSDQPRKIRVVNVSTQGNYCRMGFEAERDIVVLREEAIERRPPREVQAEQAAAEPSKVAES